MRTKPARHKAGDSLPLYRMEAKHPILAKLPCRLRSTDPHSRYSLAFRNEERWCRLTEKELRKEGKEARWASDNSRGRTKDGLGSTLAGDVSLCCPL